MSMIHEEAFHINYENIAPEEELDQPAKARIKKILENCPYNAFMKVLVSKNPGSYYVEFLIRHHHGRFLGLGEEVKLSDALDEAENSIRRQIQLWHHNRNQPSKANGMRVLLVDDDPLSTKLLASCFKKQGWSTGTAHSGLEALKQLKNQNYDLVVMDWNMSPLNGKQTVRAIDEEFHASNSARKNKKMPVLTYSVFTKEKVKFPTTENLYQLDHIPKSISFQGLLTRTKGIVKEIQSHT